MNKNLINKIEKSFPVYKIDGNEKQKTLYFEIGKREVLPGQFFMLNYNLSQKPFSVSSYNNGIIGFTIENRGDTSSKMINSKIGDYFGLVGPLGNHFITDKFEKYLIIGGGIGIAPLLYLTNFISKKRKKADIFFWW